MAVDPRCHFCGRFSGHSAACPLTVTGAGIRVTDDTQPRIPNTLEEVVRRTLRQLRGVPVDQIHSVVLPAPANPGELAAQMFARAALYCALVGIDGVHAFDAAGTITRHAYAEVA